jgi:alpha-beta hydrolase superfamily lysophospholipase
MALFGIFVFTLISSTLSTVFLITLYEANFPRYDRPKYSYYLQFSDAPAYAHSVVTFPSGKNSLTGFIFGEENTKGLVVVSPGRGEGVERCLPEILYFVDHGWRVFSFDYTGSFASEGKNSVGLPQSRVDLEAALTYIQNNPSLNRLPVVLWGFSWGGYAVAAVLKDHSNISAVVSISGFNSPVELLDEQIRNQLGALSFAMHPFGWVYQYVRFGHSAWVTAVDGINSSNTPVMIVHGTADTMISYTGASIIAQREIITNPNVIYKTSSAKDNNGHANLLFSAAAVEYSNQKNEEYKSISDRYQGNIPDEVTAEYYAGVNPFQTTDRNADLMDEINSFFESSLPD